MTRAHIEIKGLKKLYTEGIPILEDIDLTIAQGAIHVLIGASGSGKSTLLKCLNLLELPSAGEIKINQFYFNFSAASSNKVQLKQCTALRKKVGMVFQSFNLWPHLNVKQNLMLAPLKISHKSRAEIEEQALKILTKIGLANKIDAYPGQLSGGQQQRIAIARALMMDPEVLLFDEPTSALDPENVQEVLKTMQALAEEGITMLIATHEIAFAKKLAHRVHFLDQGKIIEQGAAKTLLDTPATERLRCFLQAVCH